MKFNRPILFGVILFLTSIFYGCGSQQPSSSGNVSYPTKGVTNGFTLPPLNGPNILALTVNGSTCAADSYINKPCVSIQICAPGSTSNCQTVNDILVDTGSFGLRVFKSVLNSSLLNGLTQVLTVDNKTAAECVEFGDGSKDWGPVQKADIVLGSEPAVTVPIQVIDSTFSGSGGSAVCSGAETDPTSAGLNGILGVGLLKHDCGSDCSSQAPNGLYYGCTAGVCSGSRVSLVNQVQNPVSLLPVDNNGVILELPVIPFGGVASLEGYLVLGIGTQSNNIPQQVDVYQTNSRGNFTTEYNGVTYSSSFLDSGSNGYFFPGSLSTCSSSSGLLGWFCLPSVSEQSALNLGFGNSARSQTVFYIGDALYLAQSGNRVFLELGASSGGSSFDWGLPFYVGRNVYVGFEQSTSGLGTGPYWAY